MKYEKTFKKGQVLDKDFNSFIIDSLLNVTNQRQDPDGFPHDIIVRFKENVKLKIEFEKLNP